MTMALNWNKCCSCICRVHYSFNSLCVASLLFVQLLCSVTAQVRGGDVLLVNRGISVPFGTSVNVDPVSDLRIKTRPSDTCQIVVRDSIGRDVQRPGRLNSATFPCNFGPLDMQYSHFGGHGMFEDRIQLAIRIDSNTDTVIIPFTLIVKITDKPFEIVHISNNLSVNRTSGLSSPISRSTLEFVFDNRQLRCKVRVLSNFIKLPNYGYIVNSTSSLSNVDCSEFLTLGICYKHDYAQSNTPRHDYIPFLVELIDDNGRSVDHEYFQVPVDLIFGHENSYPQPSRNALFLMDSVDQFVMTAITPDILSATDKETPSEMLLYNISQPLEQGEGIIVSTDDRNIPITSFYQSEINALNIAYKPPSTDSNVKRLFQLELTIIDSEGLTSDPIPLMIVVEPMNTLAPVVTTNHGIQLIEGQSRPLRSPDILEISDEDNLDDVKIFHIDGLRHGHLLLPPARQYFTPSDLRNGRIIYQHDDSDSFSDNIIFRMTDGMNDVEFLFPITVFPKDDQAPSLNVNTDLEVQKNQLVAVDQFVLSATDRDSNDWSIHFILEPPYSSEGILIKRQFHIPEDVQNWQYLDGVYEKFVNEFTQQDISNGQIFYRHVGSHSSDIVTDKFTFHLQDDGAPPNVSPTEKLIVKIHPVDSQPPYLYQNIELKAEVEETEMLHFRRKNLRYTDDASNDRELKYIIVRPPFDTYSAGPSDAGTIVICDKPKSTVKTFTQSQVNHHKICYNPPGSELGITTRIVQFDFNVQDTSENVLTDQRFTIVLKPVDNQPPSITNTGIALYENGEVGITPQVLDIVDVDTDNHKIVIIVTRVPQHGSLYKDVNELLVGDTFSKTDIALGIIKYKNYGYNIEVTEDTFSFDITDGIHHIPVTIKVAVMAIDDEPALFEGISESGTLIVDVQVMEGASVPLLQEHLTAIDMDTGPTRLAYTVTTPPKHGFILKSSRRTDRFTQSDVIKGLVVYEHRGGEIGLDIQNDTFELTFTDDSNAVVVDGSKISFIQVRVQVLPVNNQAPIITIGSSLDVLEGEKATLLPFHIDIEDKDSIENDILCTILEQPRNGFIENIAPREGSEKSQESMPISAFSVLHLRLGNINYVQSVHKHVEPREDIFTFYCTDGVNLTPPTRQRIVIHPSNDEEPEVHVREFIGSEGMDIRIDLPILNALDADLPPDTLHFIITSPPKHGLIVQQRRSGDIPVMNFTLDDISLFSTIIYKHDDSETRSDQFEFMLTDNKHSVTKTVPIIIFPVDDETPRIAINNGLQLDEFGERKTITKDVLKAEDLDSSISNITFIIRRVPQQGFLVKTINNRQQNLTTGSNFTQVDINNELVEYVHTNFNGKRDIITFDITDGLNPLFDRYFYVSVKGLDLTYPEVVSKGVELPEGGTIVLTTNLLSGTDVNSPDEDLTFTITHAPKHGYIEFSDHFGVPIERFTQLDIAANRVRYVHNSESEIKMDNFEFEVTDGFNLVKRTFRITLTDVDNKRPVLMISVLRLKEGSSKIITPFELKIVDKDTPDNKIIFSVIQVPLHGNLLYNYSRIVSRFTFADLCENVISYQHDGTDSTSDTFTFTVTDGTHTRFFVSGSLTPTRRPQQLQVEIIPVDNGMPHVAVNQGSTTLVQLPGGGIGLQLSNKILLGNDKDSPVASLQFTLTVGPRHGYLSNVDINNWPITSWTQDDINSLKIQYVLNIGENATEDSFFFSLTDDGGNVLANQPFHLRWAWISFQQDRLSVNETQDELVVKLYRRGYLGDTCFVSVQVVDRTARVGDDVSAQYPRQVQFNPGQSEQIWRLGIRDDRRYEDQETFILQLGDPVSAVLEFPDVAMVTIYDPEDESTVYFPETRYSVREKVSELEIPIYRVGDVSDELMVICSTQSDTAKGSEPTKVQSFTDFISRGEDHYSIVRFDKSEDKKLCHVMILDDSLYEGAETFHVVLSQPMGGRLGDTTVVDVTIEADDDDVPIFYFGESSYTVDESAGSLEVKVWKTGSDLSQPSSVTVRSRRIQPPSAESGLDYTSVNRILVFSPGDMTKTLEVTILDDLGQPHIEGAEQFELHLRMPVGGAVGNPSVTIVNINDTLSDRPQMQFKDADYTVLESEGEVIAMVTRSGDLRKASRVRCYTRQASAEVMMDYTERPDTDASLVHFKPGDRESECRVAVVNDNSYEVEETFRLVLGSPEADYPGGATLGGQTSTKVTIYDPEDKPVIQFESHRYTVNEPIIRGEVSTLRVPVVRTGDTSATSEVQVSTKSGSARAGSDFNGYSKLLRFSAGVERLYVEIEINYDTENEHGEMFSLQLSRDKNMIAIVQHTKRAVVYIEEKSQLADVVFPVPPVVVSLQDYDDVPAAMGRQPIQGYPLVCVSPCSDKHPKFPEIQHFCVSEGINGSLTMYRWRVSAPSDSNGVTSDLRDLETNTYFTTTRGITLDSVYFTGGSRVQCLARAVNTRGEPGHELASNIVAVDRRLGLCMPRIPGSVGAEPFSAKLRYMGPDSTDHANTVRITVTIPHRDGLLPVMSTRLLSNFELTVSAAGLRLGQHSCGTLLDYSEVRTRHGFITNSTRNPGAMEDEPYQYNAELRTLPTLRVYRNLDLAACLWKFEAYYDMSELVTDCGGRVNTDGQVLNVKQSYVSLSVPLYMSYLFYSVDPTVIWRNYDLRTDLQLQFVYDTSILWEDGVKSPDEITGLHGYLYPTSMRLLNNGKLVVNFRTLTQFRGQFVLSHTGSNQVSRVTSEDHRDINFALSLIRSDSTFDQPGQSWEFVSDVAVTDYSGNYTVHLVPCVAAESQSYTHPIVCRPADPVTFDLPIRFQQVSDPVAERFSLNTDFHLVSKRDTWLAENSAELRTERDVTFAPGDMIYGRVDVDSLHQLGGEFRLQVEKVFLCSGRDGYIPKYSPATDEFGCITTSPSLLQSFKILDKGSPHTVDSAYNNVPFNAELAQHDNTAGHLALQSGADGFSFDSTPLFLMGSGKQWFLHTIYTIRSRENMRHRVKHEAAGLDTLQHVFHGVVGDVGIYNDAGESSVVDSLRDSNTQHRTSVITHDISGTSARVTRDVSDVAGMGESGRGTNMVPLILDFDGKPRRREVETYNTSHVVSSGGVEISLVAIIIGAACFVLICCIFVAVILIRHHRKRTSPPPSPAGTITVLSGSAGAGQTKVFVKVKARPIPHKSEV